MAASARSIRHAASSIALEDDGSFYFACGSGAYRHRWFGFARYDRVQKKISVVERSYEDPAEERIEGPLALVGSDSLMCTLDSKTPRLVTRATGTGVATFAAVEDDIQEFAVSPRGTWVAAISAAQISVFNVASGKRTQQLDSSACGFTGDDELLYLGRKGGVHRRKPSAKKDHSVLKSPWLHVRGALQLRGEHLLSSGGMLINAKTGRHREIEHLSPHTFGSENEGVEAMVWGAGNTMLAVRRNGVVDTMNLRGQVISTFSRVRKGDVLMAGAANGLLVCTTGSFLELYELEGEALPTQLPQRKKPSRRTPVVSAASNDARAEALWAAYVKAPKETQALQVWADLLSEHGDPRGEWVQLHLLAKPAAGHEKRLASLRALGGKLVGPAREYLRTWEFDAATGLVARAICEATLFVEGHDEISKLNPQLGLVINGIKNLKMVDQLAEIDLGRFESITLQSDLTDKGLQRLAPKLRGTKKLYLTSMSLTRAGIEALAPLETLKSLRLTHEGMANVGGPKVVRQLLPQLTGVI